MTQEQILEGNKLIAEFMGWKYAPNVTNGGKASYIYRDSGGTTYATDDMFKYHSSWDWLMPVVEKIENQCSHEVSIFGSHCHINQGKTHDMGYSSKENKLLSTYFAVVEFIKWYNQQK